MSPFFSLGLPERPWEEMDLMKVFFFAFLVGHEGG